MDGCTWTGNTDGISIYDDTPVLRFTSGGITFGLNEQIREEKMMERLLTDLVVNLQLGREELDMIRAIIRHPDWKERYMLYLLADDVRSCDFMPETLGYKEEED